MGKPRAIYGVTALELTMRDVLSGMEELANGTAFAAFEGEFEILAIEPPEPASPPAERAPVRRRPALTLASEAKRQVA